MGGFNKIGSADLTGCELLVLPSAERQFRLLDENTGNINMFSDSGTNYNIVLTNCTTGFGYIASTIARESHYLFDGVTGYATTDFDVVLTDSSNFTFTFNVEVGAIGAYRLLMGKYVDASNTFWVGMTVNNRFYMNITIGGVTKKVDTTTTLSIGDIKEVTFKKVGGVLSILIDGVDDSSGADTYNLGNYTFSNQYIGTYDGSSVFWSGRYFKINLCLLDRTIVGLQNEYQLGSGLGGLLGNDLTSGEMSLSDNRIGLFNPYNNIMAALLSTDPATVDRNTGFINCFNGESATATRTGTLTNFASGEGFIAKSGAVPAHILFTLGTQYVNFGNPSELDNKTEFSSSINVVFDDLSVSQWVWLKYQAGIGKVFGVFKGPTNLIIYIYNEATLTNITYTISHSGILTNGVLANIATSYNGNGSTNADKYKLFVNGIELTGGTYSGTVPSVTPTISGNLTIGYSGGGSLVGKCSDFILNSDCKSLPFIKDQYFSSQNEWQGDLAGTLQTVPDGTLDLSSEYTYFDAQQVRLGKNAGIVTDYDWGTGRVGPYIRPVGVTNEGNEILARFDLSNIVNSTLTRLLAYSDSIGTQVASDTSRVFEQDKTSLVDVTSASAFDDFTDTAWTSQVGSVSMQGVQSYEYTLTSMDSLVSEWISNTKDQDNGIIIDVNYASAGEYNDIFSVKLGVKIGGTIIVPFHILNYLNQSF